MSIKIKNSQGKELLFETIGSTHLRVRLGDELEILSGNLNPTIVKSADNNIVVIGFENPSESIGTALKIELPEDELTKLKGYFGK